MEEIKKKAVEKMHELMEEDRKKGHEDAVRMMAEGKIDFMMAEELCDAEEPTSEEFEGKSKVYIAGFIEALEEILAEAARK